MMNDNDELAEKLRELATIKKINDIMYNSNAEKRRRIICDLLGVEYWRPSDYILDKIREII